MSTPSAPSVPPDGPTAPASAAASLDALEEQQRRTARGIRPHPLGLYLPWGVGYLVAFGGAWLASGPDAVLPESVATVLVIVGALVPGVGSAVTLSRANRGLSGPSRRVAVMYGWSWILGFAALTLVNGRIADSGVTPGTLSLIWSGSALVLVGVLLLAGGVRWPDSGQYALGVWILATAVVAVLVGYPANLLALALLGGGGLVVAAVVLAIRSGRRA